ncbi:hypothetical protein V8E36_003589 [Tilletia maclaganii]
MADSSDDAVKVWDASHLFHPSTSTTDSQPAIAIILLNAPISEGQQDIFLNLWRRATLRLCADGGANRLLDAFGRDAFTQDGGSAIPLPHEIRGDLDSMKLETRAFFEGLGVRITRRESQYATDLQKCIKAVEYFERDEPSRQGKSSLELVIYGGLSGRFDQTAHTLHVLWLLGAPVPNDLPGSDVTLDPDEDASIERREKVWVIGEQCVVWILDTGRHRIVTSSPPLGPTCGLLPFGTSTGAKIVTSGLRWNLDGKTLSSLPGFWSTSNQIELQDGKANIEITTDQPLYWSIELQGSDTD